jgi:hypothetical protein
MIINGTCQHYTQYARLACKTCSPGLQGENNRGFRDYQSDEYVDEVRDSLRGIENLRDDGQYR